MFDINPPEKHGRAMAMFGAGVMIGPILGPVLGGWLTDNFNWRWVFLINLPIGVIAVLMMLRFMPATAMTKRRFDLLGFFLIALALGGMQMMLDRGETLDWFESWEIWIECGLAISGLWMFGVHMLTARDPIFDPQMFKDRNFATGMLFMAVTGVMLLAGLALLPPMLQTLFGYSVLQSGFLTAPRGIGTLLSMIVVGRLVGKVDARLLILVGISLMAWSLWQMSGFSLQMDQRPIIVSGIIQGFALGFLFVPLNTLAFGTLDAEVPHHRGQPAEPLAQRRRLDRHFGGDGAARAQCADQPFRSRVAHHPDQPAADQPGDHSGRAAAHRRGADDGRCRDQPAGADDRLYRRFLADDDHLAGRDPAAPAAEERTPTAAGRACGGDGLGTFGPQADQAHSSYLKNGFARSLLLQNPRRA